MFVVFEGLDGSGKTTQAAKFTAYLQRQGVKVVAVEEPGGTPLGEQIRELLLSKKDAPQPLTELFLYEASRYELVQGVIRPALARGEAVVCQRYDYSSTVYQGYGRGLPLEEVETLNALATGGLRPDLVFWLDVPAEEALKRLQRPLDRLEGEGLQFLKRVERGYQEIAREHAEVVRIDGTRDPEMIFQEIISVWERWVEAKEKGKGGSTWSSPAASPRSRLG
jgi:dTMP kinase